MDYSNHLSSLHPGHVLWRDEKTKDRIRICKTSGSSCEQCGKKFTNEKCLRYEKGSLYLFWECFDCYIKEGL